MDYAASSGRAGPPIKLKKKLKKSQAEGNGSQQESQLIKAFSPKSELSDAPPKIVELLPMDKLTRSLKCTVPPEIPIFDPKPALVSFSDYEGHHKYSATLVLRNKDTVARRVKVCAPDTPFFNVKVKQQSSKVAAGMEAVCVIQFSPTTTEDYEHDLVVCTEREKFIVPIRAQGARPMLDLPDVITFGDSCPCQSTSSKTLLVCNIGKSPGSFDLIASPPFSVEPKQAFLNVGETLQLRVHLHPVKVEEVTGQLEIDFQDGSQCTTELRGRAVEIDVTVTPKDVQFIGTFVTKTTLQYFYITNRTSQPISFGLRKYANANEAEKEQAHLTDGTMEEDPAWSRSQEDVFGTRAMSAFPREGVVYPGTRMEITVEFSPYVARQFTEICYVEVEGHAERQPVQLTGMGLGPCAIFTYDVLDIGSAYINTAYRYSVQLENRGDIPAPFKIRPGDGEFGSMFTFIPSDGEVPAETILDIEVELLATHIGRLEERVLVDVAGIDSPLTLQFKGRIVGPTFDIDVDSLDFGMVAFGFRYCKDWTVFNTSEIPMQFSWRVDNGDLPESEFNIIPSKGAILPGMRQKILVEFTPRNVAKYNSQIILDIPRVRSAAAIIAATGESVVPRLALSHEVLEYGHCFLNHPYTLDLVISNSAKLPVKFEIEPQDDISVALAGFSASPSNGGIPAQGEQVVSLTLQTRRLGQIKLPCKVHAVGSLLPPIDFILAARSIGPTVSCKNPDGSLCSSISFGKISVLHVHQHVLTLHNESLIPAEITALTAGNASVFGLDCNQCVLQAGESRTLTISVHPDETFTFSDMLHIIAASGTQMEIPVSATGIGSTLYCDQAENSKLDFQHQLAGTPFARKVVIENHGRRTCNGVWQNVENELIKKKWGKLLRGQNGKPDFSQIPEAERAVFTVKPDKAVIPPKQYHEFIVHGFTPTTGLKEESLQLVVPGQEGGKAMMTLNAVASLAVPQLTFSTRTLLFEYFYHPLVERPSETVMLSVINDGMVPLNASLKSQAPFKVSPQNLQLAPGASSQVAVTMNHTYRNDLISHKPKKKLIVSFAGNPHTDALHLHGSINYPNVMVSSECISFGSTLKDTHKSEALTVTNTSAVPVKYFWGLRNESESEGIDASQIFSIKPVEGYLMPGEEDAVRITYFAKDGLQASTTAVLQVQGGPDTLVSLKAIPNHMDFSLEPKSINLGTCLYNKMSYRDLTLMNTSKVPFQWKCNTSHLKRSGSVLCTPASGTLGAGAKQILNLKVVAGIPDRVREVIYIEVAHFEPVAVNVQVDGMYYQVALSIPRLPACNAPEKLEAAAHTIIHKGSILLDMIAQKDPKVLKSIKGADHARFCRLKPELNPEQEHILANITFVGSEDSSFKRPLVPQLNGAEIFGQTKMYSDKLTQLEVEAEADRDNVCQTIIQEELKEVDALTHQEQENLKGKGQSIVQPQRLMKFAKVLAKYISKPSIAAGEYVLDFGSVVKGSHVTKTVRVQNISTHAVAVSMDKALLEAYGFELKPDKIPKLSGLPDVSCLEVTLCLNTNMAHVVPGKVDFYLPMQVQNSPPVIINVRADIATPEVTCSQQIFDFDRVPYGLAKVIMLRLHNPKKVPAEWALKKPAESGADVDWKHFFCMPDSGTLGPGQSACIRVVFLPDHPGRHGEEYKQDLPIRVTNNSKPVVLSATGIGYIQRIKVAPKLVDLGAVLPGTGQTACGEFKIKNPGQAPVEVIALDYDAQHAEEELMLASWHDCNDSTARSLECARPPGAPFWEHIRAHHQTLEAEKEAAGEKAQADVVSLEAQDNPEDSKTDVAAAVSAGPHHNSLEVQADKVKEVTKKDKNASDFDKCYPFIAFVSCFEADTEAQQADLLCERYQVPSTTLTDLVLDAGELDTPNDGDPSGRSFGDMLYDTLIGWDEQTEDENVSKGASCPYEKLSQSEISTLLGRAFKAILQEPKFAGGFVLKGFQCEFADTSLAMQQLLAALGMSKVATDTDAPFWEGDKTIWCTDLQLSVHAAQERSFQLLSDEAKKAAAQRIAEADEMRAAAILAASTPPKGKKTSGRKGAAEAVETPQYPPGIDPEFGAAFDKYTRMKQGVDAYLQASDEDPCIKVRCISMPAEISCSDELHQMVLGTRFELDVFHNVMPLVEADKNRLAPPFLMQVLKRPVARKPNPTASQFTLTDSSTCVAVDNPDSQDTSPKELVQSSRWILQPGETRTVSVQFKSDDVTDVTAKLLFQAYTGDDKAEVTVRASCAHPQICPDPHTLFVRNQKIKAGQEELQFKQCYISNRSRFQFGAVLAGVPAPEELQDAHVDHYTVLKVVNDGRFDARVSFAIKSVKAAQDLAEEAAIGKGGKGKKGTATVPVLESCFSVIPSVLEIPRGESSTAKLLCLPPEVGEVHDAILCTVDENPQQLDFAVMATGEEPKLSIFCDEQPEGTDTVPSTQPSVRSTPPAKAGKNQPPPSDENMSKMSFGRLLPGRRHVKWFSVTNTSKLPLHWTTPDVSNLPEEFKMFEKDEKGKLQPLPVVGGLLAPGETKTIHVEFLAADIEVLSKAGVLSKPADHSLIILMQDEKQLRSQVVAHTVSLSAETYIIDASISYPNDEPFLNFGSVKVQSSVSKKFIIKNRGPYPISYEAVLQDKANSFFTIQPASDQIVPNTQKEVSVLFQGNSVMKELKMTKNTPSMSILISEPLTTCTEKIFPLKVAISAVFSKFCVTPVKGISFQPTTYNTQSAPRCIELANTGIFPFQYKLLRLRSEAAQSRPDSKEDKSKPGKGKAETVNALQLGAFSLSPMNGTIAAGSSAQIQVVFNASGNQVHQEQFAIDVEDRDPDIHPTGIPVALIGESCIPGIIVDDVDGIFEEHSIRKEIDPYYTHSTQYGVAEKVFSFGNVLADLAGTMDESCCIHAQLKFTNATKVASSVLFSAALDSNDTSATPALSVVPKQAEIAPHEYQFVTLTFHPGQIAPYSGTFQAVVENGDGNPATERFTCSVRGNGIVPSVCVLQPSKLDAAGRACLEFPRRMPDRVSTQCFELRNNGTVDANVRLELCANSVFRIDSSHSLCLVPQASALIPVTFHPNAVGNHTSEVLLHVSQNPYEHVEIQLVGECSQGDIEFVVDDVETDTVHFPDSFIGSETELWVQVHNFSSKHFRVQWSAHAQIAVKPAVFHAHAKSVTPVCLRLCALEAAVLAPAELSVTVSQINYSSNSVEWNQEAIGEDGVTAVPEPKVEAVKGSEKRLTLKAHALVDDCRYQCSMREVIFSRTMMFQARSEAVTVRNTGRTQTSYSTRILDHNGLLDTKSPFSVSPESGTLSVGGEEQLTIRFCPVDAFSGQHTLYVDFPRLAKNLEPLAITLDGSVVRPWCHLEVPSSDYLQGGNRKQSPGCITDPPILDPNTTVIEIDSLGQGIANHRRFHVLNPTNVPYEFQWEMASGGAGKCPFRCYTSKGIISAGRRYEMAFEFLPQCTIIQESLWRFSIPSQAMNILVLFVGRVVEPNIAFSQSSLNFKRVLMGRSQCVVLELVNGESMPFDFSFDKDTYEATEKFLQGSGKGPALRFDPEQGTLRPNSSTSISVVYKPRAEVPINYTAICHVKHKPTPLTLNVKGEGYAVHEELQLQAVDGSEIPMSCKVANMIDLGQVHVHEKVVRSFQIANRGSIPVEFEWEVDGEQGFMVTPKSGQVSVGDRVPIELCYHPTTVQTLKDCKIFCKICSGKSYTFKLCGSSRRPALHLGWASHSFGRVYNQTEEADPHQKSLVLRNDDMKALSIVVSVPKQDVQVDTAQVTLEPGESTTCNISFAPKSVGNFRCPIYCEVNGIFKASVEVTAEVIARRLEVASSANRILDLGALRTGKSRKFTVEIVNKALLNAEISVEPSKEVARRLGLHLHVNKCQLASREKTTFTITYKPRARLGPFNEVISFLVCGAVLPLLRVKGSAVGLEAKLSAETLPFGNVMLGSSTVKALQLHNHGDVGFKFSWQTEKLAPHMSLVPTNGFLAPGQHAKVSVYLKPQSECADIRADDIQCHIEGMNEPLHLAVSGSASKHTAVESTVQFSCRVRESVSQTILLKNPSSQDWTLKPRIDNSLWSGKELVMLPARETVEYTVVYRPLSHAPAEGHTGSVFFPFPDGTGMLYNLQGTSTDPAPVAVLQRELTVRQAHTENLCVCNWLNKGQVLVTSVVVAGGMENCTDVAVPPHLDIPPLADKPCKLSITPYKAGKFDMSVYFKNKVTEEYVFYKLELDVKEAGPIDTVVLATPVRCKASWETRIKNPLGSKLLLTGSCTTSLISFPKAVELDPHDEAVISIGFMPLLVSEQNAVLTYTCPDIGQYQYNLSLVGQNGPAQGTINFKVPLGASETKTFQFTNLHSEKCDYAASIEKDGALAFSSAQSVAALGGESVEASVIFQPTSVGETHSTLTLSSPTGGEFVWVLRGIAAEPMPQGPVKVNKSTTIPFTNPFLQDCDFTYSCNNPLFVIKADTKVKARAKVSIAVSIGTGKDTKGSKDAGKDTAKSSSKHAMLTIACPSQTASKWCYYLEQC